MIRLLTIAAAAVVALPAIAQTSATHVDTTGAVSGRMPHKAMRQIAAEPNCGKTIYLPSGKLPSYGNPALASRCRQTELARTETKADIHE